MLHHKKGVLTFFVVKGFLLLLLPTCQIICLQVFCYVAGWATSSISKDLCDLTRALWYFSGFNDFNDFFDRMRQFGIFYWCRILAFWGERFSNKTTIKTVWCRILTCELLHSAEFILPLCRIWQNISDHLSHLVFTSKFQFWRPFLEMLTGFRKMIANLVVFIGF